ncbi:guanylate kinase [Patescibacteria group bacterium]|jgi:guanylate kinase|nr:guanylate kinase [Patescibacteria group bacterium]
MAHGHIVLIFGPSGSGKGTLVRMLREARPDLVYAASYTTRAPRPGESQGEPYFFKSHEEFQAHIDAGDMLEWAQYSGNHYGTARAPLLEPVADGKIALKEMEVQGIEIVLRELPRELVKLVYIDAGSWEELRARIEARHPMDEAELAERKAHYDVEVAWRDRADVVINNHDGTVEDACDQLVAFVDSLKVG